MELWELFAFTPNPLYAEGSGFWAGGDAELDEFVVSDIFIV
jgi:hypothetical protein